MAFFKKRTSFHKLSSQDKRRNNPFEQNLPELTFEETEKMINFFAMWEIPYEGFDFDPTNKDDMFIIASRYVVREQKGSISMLQDKLYLSFQFAGYLIDMLEAEGIVGPFKEGNIRDVNLADEESLNQFLWDLNEEEKGSSGYGWVTYEPFASPQIIDFIEDNREEIKTRREQYLRRKEMGKEELEKEEIKQRILEKERKKQLEREAMSELFEDGMVFNNGSEKMNREPIPQDVMDKVWNRDGGKCVKCGSTVKLEFDHIIPISKGGANTYRNLQLLCENCNRKKSNKIG